MTEWRGFMGQTAVFSIKLALFYICILIAKPIPNPEKITLIAINSLWLLGIIGNWKLKALKMNLPACGTMIEFEPCDLETSSSYCRMVYTTKTIRIIRTSTNNGDECRSFFFVFLDDILWTVRLILDFSRVLNARLFFLSWTLKLNFSDLSSSDNIIFLNGFQLMSRK